MRAPHRNRRTVPREANEIEHVASKAVKGHAARSRAMPLIADQKYIEAQLTRRQTGNLPLSEQ